MQFAFDLDSGTTYIDPPRARVSDPITSHQAAASAKDLAAQHHILILGALRRGPARSRPASTASRRSRS